MYLPDFCILGLKNMKNHFFPTLDTMCPGYLNFMQKIGKYLKT